MAEFPNHRLVVVALWLSDDRQDEIARCIDEWMSAGLLGHVRMLDLSDEYSESLEYPTSTPGQAGWYEVTGAFNARPWKEVVIVSCRSGVLGSVDEKRVHREEQLQKRVQQSYPVGAATKTFFYTLTICAEGTTFSNSQLPFGYTTNLLHEDTNMVDRYLALQPMGSDEASTLAFTGLVCAGGFNCQQNLPLIDKQDAAMSADRPTRMVRALGRAASAGFMLDSGIRKILTPETGFSLASTASIKVVEDDPRLIQDFANQVIKTGRFGYESLDSEKRDEPDRIGPIKAIRAFLSDFGGYLKKALIKTVSDEIESKTQKFTNAFQDVLFGADSRVLIKGSYLDTPEEITTELSRRMQLIEDIDGIDKLQSGAIPDRAQWEVLVQSCLALIDGSDVPDSITRLDQVGIRSVVPLPSALGPSPKLTEFRVNPESLSNAGIPLSFASVDLLDNPTVRAYQKHLDDAKISNLFKPAVIEKESDVSIESNLRGSLVRDARIKASSTAVVEESIEVETPAEISKRMQSQLDLINKDHSKSVLARIAQSIEEGFETAKKENKTEEIIKKLEALSEVKVDRKGYKKFTLGSLGALVGMSGLALLAKAFGFIALAVTPLLLFAGLIWLFSFATALLVKVFRLALKIRRDDFKRKSEKGEIELLMRGTMQSIKEFSRLVFVQRQFADWNVIIRELAYSPFGRLSDLNDTADRLLDIPRPPQFATARVIQNNNQKLQIQKEIWLQILQVGYLKSVFETIRSKWFQEYSITVADATVSPEGDTGAKRVIAGLTGTNNRQIFNPRSDFAFQVCGNDLRMEYTQSLMSALSAWFSTRDISDVFSETEHASSGHHAFDHYPPKDFLYSAIFNPESVVPNDFKAGLFKAESGRLDDNVEERISSLYDDTLGAFPIELGKPMILMTWVVELGYRVDLPMLKGFVNKGGSGAQPGNPVKPDVDGDSYF